MKNSRLAAPLRIFWDVNYLKSYSDKPALQKENILKIADEIIACKPFFVNLGEDILNYEQLAELLEKFSLAKIKLSLSSSNLIAADKGKYGFLKEHKLDFMEFRLDPHIGKIKKDKNYLNKICETLKVYESITKKVCPSLVITKENFELLPYLLDYFIERGIKYFKMPNTVINERNIGKAEMEHLIYDDVKKLKEIIGGRISYIKSKMELFIHDLFIFEIFYPAGEESSKRSEYGGCQAGNALCYIDQKGDLYLCSSLYISLGNVLKEDIKSLFKSEKRLNYKNMIEEQYSKQCVQCIDFSKCRGGCRGIVYFMNDSFLGLDPLCPYKGDE